MKTNIQFLAAVVPFLMAAGCATDHEPVYFASAAKLPATPPDAYAPAKGLPKADERRIQMVVFGYLLDRHFWDDANHTAIFVQADDEVVGDLMKKYASHVPPIKESYHIDLRSNQSPRDRDTGKPVMILGAEVGEPNPDGSVDVIGRWYAGGAVQGFYTFSIKMTGGDWAVASVK